MQILIAMSLLLNVVVLVPVCVGIFANAAWVNLAYGAPSAARSILLSVYIAFAIVSALLLLVNDPRPVLALLLVQVIYKLSTPFTVGSFGNPVVKSNVMIALVHSATIAVILQNLLQ